MPDHQVEVTPFNLNPPAPAQVKKQVKGRNADAGVEIKFRVVSRNRRLEDRAISLGNSQTISS